MFCKDCGSKISENAITCPKCGCPTHKKNNGNNGVALLLCFFLGVFGAHRFYVGKNGSAIAMLILSITIIGLFISGIWSLVDFIMIICGKFTDRNGKKLSWD